jgi:uncharacterized protein YndB with AHSA1/START domain
MQRDIKLNWFYPYPPETIWECLTEPELLKQWSLSSGEFRAEVGFKWMEARKPKPRLNWDGKMYFEVLEVIPFKKLSYSFKGGPREGVFTLDTIVTWTLAPKGDGTELRLEHTGFRGMQMYFTSFMMELGWKKHLSKKLIRVLQTHLHGQR